MKRIIKNFYLCTIILLLTVKGLRAQTVSGTWDAANTTAATGYFNYGSGVIRLLDTDNTNACQGAAVHETSSTFDPTTTFNKCYKVYFGCPGNDNIGSDLNGDGLAFSFSKCGAYNINNGACGGGLGYHGACPQMITIEFDTYDNQCTNNFDCNYGGGTSGNHDEIAIHRDGISDDGGRLTSVDAGNLEDGLEHIVCINYNPSTHVISVSIDGNNLLSYDLGATYNLQNYFGAGGLNQTWSSGKAGATNPATVADNSSTSIASVVGGPLCPASVVITSPANGTSFGACNGPITIDASVTPPANNTTDFVEFFVDGVSIGTDNTSNYGISWNSLTNGAHVITAVAHYIPSNTTSTSSPVNVTIGGGIELTTSSPVIDGTVDLIWGNYIASPLTNTILGSISGASDASATFRTMRDANKLYFLLEITDDDLWNDGGLMYDNDGMEIMIDMGNDKSGSYGANDFQYAFGYNNAVVTEYYHAPASTTGVIFSQGPKAGGYIIEISIPWTTLGGAPANGDLIGLDVHMNDDDGGGARDAKLSWFDLTDNAYHDPSKFGTIVASSCNPCPSAVLTGNATICNDGATTSPLSINFTGPSTWTITYSIDGVTQTAVSGINTSPYILQSSTGTHTYTLVSVSNQAVGCAANVSGTATINAVSFPIGHNGTFTLPSGTTTLSVDDLGATYLWYDAPVGGNLVFTGPVFSTSVLNDTTKYYVQVASSTACRTEVIAIPTGKFFIPNLITPNGDGKNDFFAIEALPSGSSLNVFNRWGDKIYQSSSYDNLWAGHNESDGVYYFDLILPDGKKFKGWLDIVR